MSEWELREELLERLKCRREFFEETGKETYIFRGFHYGGGDREYIVITASPGSPHLKKYMMGRFLIRMKKFKVTVGDLVDLPPSFLFLTEITQLVLTLGIIFNQMFPVSHISLNPESELFTRYRHLVAYTGIDDELVMNYE